MTRVLDDDGGLGSSQAELVATRTAEQQAQVDRENTVAEALDYQRTRVGKAIAAFLRVADEKDIKPKDLVSRMVRQPQRKVRWWQNEPPENTTADFVRWPAEYLEEPAIRGAADDVNRRRFGSSY
jgi:hypothetical protein